MKKPLGGGLVVNKLIRDGLVLCETREDALNLIEWIGEYVIGQKCTETGLTIHSVRTMYRDGKNFVVVS